MSALGHKRTFAVQKGMSALPPKADMCSATRYVRFVPKADILKSHGFATITQTKGQVLAKARPQALCIRPRVL